MSSRLERDLMKAWVGRHLKNSPDAYWLRLQDGIYGNARPFDGVWFSKGGPSVAIEFKVDRRKKLAFKLSELPEMSRGKGVRMQKFKDGGLSDAKAFHLKSGLTYLSRGSETPVKDIKLWLGARAQAGRLPPNGFPKAAKFS